MRHDEERTVGGGKATYAGQTRRLQRLAGSIRRLELEAHNLWWKLELEPNWDPLTRLTGRFWRRWFARTRLKLGAARAEREELRCCMGLPPDGFSEPTFDGPLRRWPGQGARQGIGTKERDG